MKKIFTLLGLLLFAQPVLAHTPSQITDPLEPQPLDVVFKHLDSTSRHLKNPKARALGRAYDALEEHKTGRARNLAFTAIGDPLFSDYAQWIVGSAFLSDSEKFSGDPKKAATSAQVALNHFKSILGGSPYSPLIRLAPREIAEASLWIANGAQTGKQAARLFEDAWLRLSATGEIGDVTPDQVLRYAQACTKAPDDLCSPWILRLTERMDRSTEEFDSIAEMFPIIRDRPRPAETPSRATQPYHAPDLDVAAFEDAMNSYGTKSWADAQTKLQKFIDEFPKSSYRYRARYWLARTFMERNQKDDAQKVYELLRQDSPLSFYGLISSIELGKRFDEPIKADEPNASERDPMISAPELYHLKRAEILIAEKADDLAAMDLREIRPRAQLSSPFLMYLCALNERAKSYPMLFVLLSELLQRNYPGIASEEGLKMIFPVENLAQIEKNSKDLALDPVLVLSLIKQESAFDPHAHSGAGAAGLMQLMYFTATQVSPGISREDLLDPEMNIQVGSRYLAGLLERYHGNVVFALAAYNAGPIAVDRWIREAGKQKLGMLEFIESIPYRETRDYVSSIIRNYYWYSKLLSSSDTDTATPDPKPLSYFWKDYSAS